MVQVTNLLAKNIHDITYNDVVAFCQQQVIEGVQLDYKETLPKDLAKQFAAFSNTKGGLIIIGVGEDKKTGLPATWNGLANNGKIVDQIHQFAANVSPLPTYDIRTTDEQGGNVFFLIRINEGAAPPYVTLSDPTVWIRNGNIRTPASREELLRLDGKRRDAQTARFARIAFAERYFKDRIAEVEQKRQQSSQAGEENIYPYPLGSEEHRAILSLTVQPYYPEKPLIAYQNLLGNVLKYCEHEMNHTVFGHGQRIDTLPGGIAVFNSNMFSGDVICEQLYANGVYSLMKSIISDKNAYSEKTQEVIHINIIAMDVYSRLKIVQRFYKMSGYSGLVIVMICLKGGSGTEVNPLQTPNSRQWLQPQYGKVRLSSYDWQFELDTATLYDESALNQLFSTIIREISWGLGIPEVNQAVINSVLQHYRWLAPAPSNS